jgi:inner membrane protein involved in colicin E2 resistance
MRNATTKILKLFILILFSFSFQTIWAQNTTVSGKLIDAKTKESLAYANVSVFNSDDELVTGAVTPESGVFQLQVPNGEYTLRIQFISYQTINRKLVADKSTIDFGTIELSEDVNQLSEVEVVARRPQMEMKLDKRIFNVSEDLSNIGSNAESLLDNLPSVTVDIEGNVSLRGSGNVRILIDGRPSGLVGISGGSALR